MLIFPLLAILVPTIFFSVFASIFGPEIKSSIFQMFLPFIINAIVVSIIILLILILIIIFFRNQKLKKVSLEDVDFSKKYDIEAEDQIEARCILTPAFMNRLNNLKTIFGSKKIWCYFDNNEVTFAIKTSKDLFEIGDIHTPVTNIKQAAQFLNEVAIITEIIDHLKLNEKIKS